MTASGWPLPCSQRPRRGAAGAGGPWPPSCSQAPLPFGPEVCSECGTREGNSVRSVSTSSAHLLPPPLAFGPGHEVALWLHCPSCPGQQWEGCWETASRGRPEAWWVLFHCGVCSFSTWPPRAGLACETDSSLKGLCSQGSLLRQEANQGACGGRWQPGSSLPCGPQCGVRSTGRKDGK